MAVPHISMKFQHFSKTYSLTLLIMLLSPVTIINAFAGVDEPCENNATCTTQNSFCALPEDPLIPGKCTCLPDHLTYASSDEDCDTEKTSSGHVSCLPILNMEGDRCSVDLQCTSGNLRNLSFCKDGNCQCFENATNSYYGSPGCVPLATNLGDECPSRLGFECKIIPYAECVEDLCSCGSGTVASLKDTVTCLVAATKIGDFCETEDVQCSLLPNSKCDENNGNNCLCINESFVANELFTGCFEKVNELTQPCNESVQCQMDNSWCVFEGDWSTGLKNGTCRCLNDFVESERTPNTCVAVRRELNGECTENIQCTAGMGPHSECGDSGCICKNDGIFHKTQCYPKASLGDRCLIPEQCVSDPSVIFDGNSLVCFLEGYDSQRNESIHVCRCPRETHREMNGVCYKATGFGLNCTSDEQCRASSSLMVCDAKEKTCTCPGLYWLSSDMTRCIRDYAELGEECQETWQCNAMSGSGYRYCDFEKGTCECWRDSNDCDPLGTRSTSNTPSTSTTSSSTPISSTSSSSTPVSSTPSTSSTTSTPSTTPHSAAISISIYFNLPFTLVFAAAFRLAV